VSGIGHNGGPGAPSGWHRYAWRRARAELLPTLPLEIVRLRVRRARELGIDYKSYASIRAATGRDVIALLFSSNALKTGPKLVAVPEAEAARLRAVAQTQRLAAVHRPLDPHSFHGANAAIIDAAAQAPTLADGWSATREKLAELTSARGLPSDAVVVIGATMLEAEWPVAGRMAGYLPAERYFGQP
tara:strand:+ start:17004 stop:17564 length:561 start_codon:yes stop_codon:yes gene_type:complete